MSVVAENTDEMAKKLLSYEGTLVVSEEGSFNGKVYYIIFGRRRHVPGMDWIFNHGFDADSIQKIPDDYLLQFKYGPSVPLDGFEGQFDKPELKLTIGEMRQVMCCKLQGNGYEFGAGPRPLVVPVEAKVSYVDRFTYEETADGSYVQFKGNFDDFVPIDLVDSFDEMKLIPPESADFLIASNVIEHVRDPMGVMINAYSRLKPGGHLVLMVPDQKKTFDLPRATTSLDHLIADHFCPDRNRDLEHYIEYHRLVLNTPAYESDAMADMKRNRDLHYHTFTFESFGKIVEYLRPQAPWTRMWSHPARNGDAGKEFYWLFEK